uniref:GTP cyclohydrolase II n=1 Tax=Eutreptiella gymnastica TaxID=73025 RepID=A0A7S4FQJ2_9EUGL
MYVTGCFQTATMACHHSLPTLSSMTLDEASSCTQCAGSTSSRKLLAALSVLGTTVGITMAMHATVSGDRAAAVQLQLINPAASHVGSTASRLRVPPSMRQPAHRSGVIASALADPGIQASDLPPTQVRSESVQAQVLSAAETIAPSVVMERPSEEFLRAERASKTSSFLACALALGGLLLGAWAIMRGFQRRPRQSTTEAAAEGRTRTYASMCTAPNEPSINQLVYAFTEKSAEETVVSMATPHKERTRFVAETLLPTTSGTYRVRSYKHTLDGITFTDPIAIIAGKPEGAESVPVRVHDACWTSEVIGSLKCDCAQQLAQAMDYIRDNEQGIVLYLHQEGRGIGLANKIAAYRMQEQGVDTVEANRMLGLPDDSREYTAVKDILEDINVQSIGLMTNNPRKVKELRSLGISISKRISCIVADPGEIASQYVQTKREQMGHFDSDEEDVDVLCVWTEDEQKAQRFGTKGAHGDGGF